MTLPFVLQRIGPALALLALALAMLAPAYVYPVFLMKLMCFALFASAFNLMVGYVGLLAFGHAMFFGGAGYVAGIALQSWGVTPEVAILAAMIFAAAAGLLMGLLAIGKHGIYFAMITLALAQMFYFFCVQSPLTGGENGLTAIPRGSLFGVISLDNDRVLYYVLLAIFVAAILFLRRVVHSPMGQVLRGISSNAPRATSLGLDVERFKLLAFVLSATLAGLAGAMKVLVLQLVTLVDVSWLTSGEVILMVLIGGIGTISGPIIGAAVILVIQNYLTGFAEWVITIQGLIFFMVVLLFRRGIVGELKHRTDQYLRRHNLPQPSRTVNTSLPATDQNR